MFNVLNIIINKCKNVFKKKMHIALFYIKNVIIIFKFFHYNFK